MKSLSVAALAFVACVPSAFACGVEGSASRTDGSKVDGSARGTGQGRPVVAATMTLQVPVERLSAMDKVSLPVRRRMQGRSSSLPDPLPKTRPISHEKPGITDAVSVTASRQEVHITEADMILFGDMVDARIKAAPTTTPNEDEADIPY